MGSINMWDHLQALIESATGMSAVVSDIHFQYEEVTQRGGDGSVHSVQFIPTGVTIQVEVR
jgi:metallophosphoesterase superfamily enzyme